MSPIRPPCAHPNSEAERHFVVVLPKTGFRLTVYPLPSPTATGRNLELDGVRGVAATVVIFYHAILHTDPALVSRVLLPPIQDMTSIRDVVTKLSLMLFDGQAAVMIFFVLSGLVLHQSLQREDNKPILSVSLRFTIARIFRILPAVIVCMVGAYLISRAYLLTGLTGFPYITADQVWRNALLVEITIHGPSASVQTELAAIPILLVCSFMYRTLGPIALLLCFLFTIIQIQTPILFFRYAGLWPNAFAFVGGMLLAVPAFRANFEHIGARSVTAVFCFFIVCRHIVPGQSIAALIAQTICCVLLVGATAQVQSRPLSALLRSRPVQFLGRISYSLYLFNVIILLCLWSTPWFGVPTTYGVETGLLVGIVATIMTLPIADASERWIERPGIALGKKLSACLPFSTINSRKENELSSTS